MSRSPFGLSSQTRADIPFLSAICIVSLHGVLGSCSVVRFIPIWNVKPFSAILCSLEVTSPRSTGQATGHFMYGKSLTGTHATLILGLGSPRGRNGSMCKRIRQTFLRPASAGYRWRRPREQQVLSVRAVRRTWSEDQPGKRSEDQSGKRPEDQSKRAPAGGRPSRSRRRLRGSGRFRWRRWCRPCPDRCTRRFR